MHSHVLACRQTVEKLSNAFWEVTEFLRLTVIPAEVVISKKNPTPYHFKGLNLWTVLFWNNSWQANNIFWNQQAHSLSTSKRLCLVMGIWMKAVQMATVSWHFFSPIYVMIYCWKKSFCPPVQKCVYSLTAYLTLCFYDLLELQRFRGIVQMSNTKQLSATVVPLGQFDLNNNYPLWKGHFPSCSILSNFFPHIFSPQEPRWSLSFFYPYSCGI